MYQDICLDSRITPSKWKNKYPKENIPELHKVVKKQVPEGKYTENRNGDPLYLPQILLNVNVNELWNLRQYLFR